MTAYDALPPLVSPKQLAEWLGTTVEAVYQMHYRGTAPRRFRIGSGLTRYRREDVIAWVESGAVEDQEDAPVPA